MNQFLAKNKTIIVRSSPSNPKYLEMKNIVQKDASIKNGLEQRNLEIVEDTSAKSDDFALYLYGQNGSLFFNENSFDNGTFDRMFKTVDSMTRKPSQSGGSKAVDYKQKYYKYKHKYEELQNVVTTYNAFGGGVKRN